MVIVDESGQIVLVNLLSVHLFGFERGDEPAGEQNVNFGRRGRRCVAPRGLCERAALGRPTSTRSSGSSGTPASRATPP